jgi:predicted negative regulator of RcsB-dependent stress response
MDADVRHQLKTNELALALARLRELRDPKSLLTLAALLVVVAAVVGWFVWKYSREHSLEQGWARLAKISSSLLTDDPVAVIGAQSDLRAMIQQTSDPRLVGYARLRLARSRIDQAFNQPTQRQEALEEAADLLRQVLSDPQTPPLLHAPASFLLATAYESLRQMDKAREQYEALTTEERYAGSPYRGLAAARLDSMAALETPVVFEPGNPPAPTQPATSPTPVELTPIEIAPPAATEEESESPIPEVPVSQPAKPDPSESP